LSFLPPMMIAILVAKSIADRYAKEPLYASLIHQLGMPHLDPAGANCSALIGRTARHLMSHPVIVMRERELRGAVRDALSGTEHGAFPVVDSAGRLRGIVLRVQLTDVVEGGSEFDLLDLTKSMSTSPFTVLQGFDARLAYLMFQDVGMRHLIVLSNDMTVAGIITRKDLAGVLEHADLHHADLHHHPHHHDEENGVLLGGAARRGAFSTGFAHTCSDTLKPLASKRDTLVPGPSLLLPFQAKGSGRLGPSVTNTAAKSPPPNPSLHPSFGSTTGL